MSIEIYLFVCLPARLSVCLPASLLDSQYVGKYVSLSFCLNAITAYYDRIEKEILKEKERGREREREIERGRLCVYI